MSCQLLSSNQAPTYITGDLTYSLNWEGGEGGEKQSQEKSIKMGGTGTTDVNYTK